MSAWILRIMNLGKRQSVILERPGDDTIDTIIDGSHILAGKYVIPADRATDVALILCAFRDEFPKAEAGMIDLPLASRMLTRYLEHLIGNPSSITIGRPKATG